MSSIRIFLHSQCFCNNNNKTLDLSKEIEIAYDFDLPVCSHWSIRENAWISAKSMYLIKIGTIRCLLKIVCALEVSCKNFSKLTVNKQYNFIFNLIILNYLRRRVTCINILCTLQLCNTKFNDMHYFSILFTQLHLSLLKQTIFSAVIRKKNPVTELAWEFHKTLFLIFFMLWSFLFKIFYQFWAF